MEHRSNLDTSAEITGFALALIQDAEPSLPQDVDRVLDELEHSHGARRAQLLRFLAVAPGPRSRAALARALVRESDASLRLMVLAAAALDAQFPKAALLAASTDSDAALRLASIEPLARAGLREAVVARIDDEDARVAGGARRACEAQGWETAPRPVPRRLLERLRERGTRFFSVQRRTFGEFVETSSEAIEALERGVRSWAAELQFAITPTHMGAEDSSVDATVHWDSAPPAVPRFKKGKPPKSVSVVLDELEYVAGDLVGSIVLRDPATANALRGGWALMSLRCGVDSVRVEPIELLGEGGSELIVSFRASLGPRSRGSFPVLEHAEVTLELFPPDWAAA